MTRLRYHFNHCAQRSVSFTDPGCPRSQPVCGTILIAARSAASPSPILGCPRSQPVCGSILIAARSAASPSPILGCPRSQPVCGAILIAARSAAFSSPILAPGVWAPGVVLCQRPPRRRYQSKKREKVGLVWSWTVNRKVVVLDHHPEKPWVLDPRGPRETVLDRNLGVF